MDDNNEKPKAPNALKKLLSVIKSWRNLAITQKPDSPDFTNYPNWKQSESDYQKEQEEWLKKIKKK